MDRADAAMENLVMWIVIICCVPFIFLGCLLGWFFRACIDLYIEFSETPDQRAARQLDAEYRATRQAMNDAAGTSYRNLVI